MAVTLTLDELRGYIQTAAEFAAVPDRTADGGFYYLPGWFEAATDLVQRYAPSAPDSLHNRAVQM